MPVLDFSSPEAFTLQSNMVTLTSPTGHNVIATTTFYTASGANGVLGIHGGSATGASFSSIPPGLIATGDIQRLTLLTASATAQVNLGLDLFYHTATDGSVQLGPDPDAPTFTTLAGPYIRPKADVASQPE